MRLLISTTKAAEMLNVSRGTIHTYDADGGCTATRLTG